MRAGRLWSGWLLPGCFIAMTAAAPSAASGADATPERPNVVFILTDNHGAWTLGCYGNKDIRTPNIDRLATEGIRFTNAFSSNAVCSPTRATYLTGLLPSQHGVHCFLRGGEAQVGPDAYSTIEEFETLPEILTANGYHCGLSGKWHLGKNETPHLGFREWATMPHGGTSTFYNANVIENGETKPYPGYLTDLWTERAVTFLKSHRDERFFLFLSYNGPYGLSRLLLRAAQNRHYAEYADEQLPSFPRGEMHPWLFNNKEYFNNIVSIRRFAAELSGVDDGVGTVMKTLGDLGLDENTLVVFTADQGWAGGQHGIWGMGDHTRPLHAFDGGMHIPLIYRQPGRIPAETTSDMLTSNYDFLPTLLSHLGISDGVQSQPASPGRDYSAALVGNEVTDWDDTVYYDFENTRAIRTASWKYVARFPDGPYELYDLEADPGETFNLYGQPRHAETQGELARRMHDFFAEHASPKYDLWNGGGTKPRLLTEDAFPQFRSAE